MTGQRVRLAGGKWSGWACVSAGMLAGDALDVVGWDVEKVCGDGSVAAGDHEAGTLDALVNGVGGLRGPGVSVRAGELALQVGERVDDCRGFEGPVSSADGDLGQDPGGYQTLDGGVGLRVAAADQRGGSARR